MLIAAALLSNSCQPGVVVGVLELEGVAAATIDVLDFEGVTGVSADILKDEFGDGIIGRVLVASSVVESGSSVPQIVISGT